MKKLIELDAALDALNRIEISRNASWYEFYQKALTAVGTLPSAQPRWIPVTERLPEEYGEYRITWTTSASKKRFVGDAEYEVTDEWDDKRNDFKSEWLLDDYIKAYPDVHVIAWKPLEEPYRPEGEEHGTPRSV